MHKRSTLLKTFLLISLPYTLGILVWLLATPSLSTDKLLLGSYSPQRLVLIAIPAALLLLEGAGLLLAKRERAAQFFARLLASKMLFLAAFFLFWALLIFHFYFLMGSLAAWAQLILRILPLNILLFLLLSQLLAFHLHVTKGQAPLDVASAGDYTDATGRDARLDFLRGFFIFVMIVDHISERSPLYLLTFGNQFFTSAAEGFFLISGIVTGIVYEKLLRRSGLKAGIHNAISRLGTLYLITIVSSAFFVLVNLLFRIPWGEAVAYTHAFEPLRNLLLFITQYPYADILVVYVLFFLFLPFALTLLKYRKTLWLALLSLGVYAAYLIFPGSFTMPIHTFMNFYGAQLFFFGGLMLGYHHVLERLQHKLNGRLLAVLGGLFLCLLVLWDVLTQQSVFARAAFSPQATLQLLRFFDKTNVGAGRFLASLIVFGFLYVLLTLKWERINKLLGWLLLPLGQNSLFAFVTHMAMIYLFALLANTLHYDRHAYWLNAGLQLAAVLANWFLTKKQALLADSTRKAIYYSVSAATLVLFVVFQRTLFGV